MWILDQIADGYCSDSLWRVGQDDAKRPLSVNSDLLFTSQWSECVKEHLSLFATWCSGVPIFEVRIDIPVIKMFSSLISACFLFKKETSTTSWDTVQRRRFLCGAKYIKHCITGFLVWIWVRTQLLKWDAISQAELVWDTAMEQPPCFEFPFSLVYLFDLWRS